MATKNEKIGVLFASFEAMPFLKTGGLGDVAGSLPKALKKEGYDVRVVLPKVSCIPDKYKSKMKHIKDFYFPLSWRSVYCGIEEYTLKGITYYFIDNEYYFRRDGIYGYFDDGERMAYFSKAICEIIPYIPNFNCRILHCNDWHTALAPVFLRECYRNQPIYDRIRSIFTVHNIKFQGQMSDYVLGDILGLSQIPAANAQLHINHDTINFMKGALSYSDLISTVSPSYAQEIQNPFYGEHLERIFQRRWSSLWGILNGIDTEFFNPEKDKALTANYSADYISGKSACKKALQNEFCLEEDEDIPIIIMVGRLTQQKGLDLVACILDELLNERMQLIVLGTGDQEYEWMLKNAEYRHPDKMRVCLNFDEALSHRMYAGADMLLMPSLFEPCGLTQMISMRYGTLPIVRQTGGLRDSVSCYNEYTGEGTGFGFNNYNAHELLYTTKNAMALYHSHKDIWEALMHQAMTQDFSWDNAAKTYDDMYKEVLK